MGPNGYAKPDAEAKAGHFNLAGDTRGWGDSFVIAKDGIFVPDFMAQTVTNIFTPVPGQNVISATQFYPEDGNGNAPKDYAIATDQSLIFLPEGKPPITVPQIPNIKAYPTLQIYRINGGEKYFLLYNPEDSRKYKPLLREISAQGAILNEQELPTIREPKQPASLVSWVQAAQQPIGERLWGQAITFIHYSCGDKQAWPIWKYNPEQRAYFLKFWYASIIASIICVGLVQIPLRRPQFTGQRIGWTIFVLFYGIGGLLAFYIVQNWPRREVCVSCQKKRSTERETCEHCGATWPQPQRDGTEIFEAAK
jgi:hypothetical protein